MDDAEVFPPELQFVVRSTVRGLAHVGHSASPEAAEYSIKQPLQKICSQDVTCDNNCQNNIQKCVEAINIIRATTLAC